jgi:predicted HTH transcriptional regulator
MTAWEEQDWKKPEFEFSNRTERVTLNLEVGQVVYIPGATDLRSTPQTTTQATQATQTTTQTTTQATQTTTQTFQDATQTSNIQKQILDLVKYNGELSQKEIADEIGENYNTVKYHIQQMKKKGIIERIGTSHKGHWKVRNI